MHLTRRRYVMKLQEQFCKCLYTRAFREGFWEEEETDLGGGNTRWNPSCLESRSKSSENLLSIALHLLIGTDLAAD